MLAPRLREPRLWSWWKALAPHITHAHRLHETLQTVRAERAMLTEAAGKAQLAVVMLNARGEVMQMTPSAHTILVEGDGLILRGKRLRATLNTEHPAFSALLAEAAHAGMSGIASTQEKQEDSADGEGASW